MAFAKRLLWVFALVPCVGVACGEDARELSLCDQVTVKNTLCAVDLEQRLSSGSCSDDSEETHCLLHCGLRATCSELADTTGLFGSSAPGDRLVDCLADCGLSLDAGGIDGFDCGDGRTINSAWVCDGILDCTNGADEDQCPTTDLFECGNDGGTVPSVWLCDGVFDCPDGSDEADCERDGGSQLVDGGSSQLMDGGIVDGGTGLVDGGIVDGGTELADVGIVDGGTADGG